jgi:hypothetical protein
VTSFSSDPIVGPVARIDRAKFHLDQLVSEVETFLGKQPSPYPTTTERDDKRHRYIFRVHPRDEPPPSLPFLAGDFIHNARAALDNIVWALAPAQVRRRQPSFPIYDDPIGFLCEARPMLKGMAPKVIEAIEWCQPYHGDEHIVSASRLLHINQLWSSDKHRAPLALGATPDMASYALFYDGPDFPQIRVFMGQALTENKPIAWIPFHPSLEDNFNPHFHFAVAFKGTGQRLIPYYGLMKAHKIISEEVVGAIRRAL